MLRFLIRIRVLPITIFVAGFILTAKLGDVADVVGSVKPSLHVAKVQAQQPAPAQNQPQPKGPTPLQAPPSAAAPAPQPQAQAPGAAPAPAQAPAQPPAAGGAEPAPVPATAGPAEDPANDPTLLTQNEIDILQQLAERREELERQSQELVMRQGLMQAAEQRIDRKIQELKGLQSAIEGLIKKHDEQEEQKVRSLVKLYENMKPKDAARIFEELDLDTILLVAERMNERKLAPIMSNMDAAKAKDVTVRLTNQRKLPRPGTSVGG